MADAREDEDRDQRLHRRAFLRRGGIVAGGAALGAAVTGGTAGAQVSAQAVDFTYVPVGPFRIYDSRLASGPLSNGQDRALYTAYETVDPPPIAVTLNVTVTQTVGAGWLAVYPADTAFSGTSSINWFGNNQDLANNAYVAIPLNGDANDGVIRIRAGGIPGARAQFILDVIGATAGFDFSAVSASDARGGLSALGTTWTER